MKHFSFALLLMCVAVPVAAQETRPDSILTPQQRAMEKLRALGRIGDADSLKVKADSAQRQQQGLEVQRGSRTQRAAAAPTTMQRDSIMESLMAISGYMGTEFSGGKARFQADSNKLVMRENAQVSREGNVLAADSSITYDEKAALACGYGNPVLTAADMANPVVSDTVCFNIQKRIGYAKGAKTTVSEGASWHVTCNATFQGDDLFCYNAIFTDCNETHPHYHFGASELKAQRGNMLVARNVTLSFADVPVFWLPFMVQSLSRGRRSGILMPRFGINDIARNSTRYNRRIEDVGVYWAVNEYMGTELAMDWFANNWTAVRGSFDYNLPTRFLRGGLTHRQFWAEGRKEFTIASNNSWEPNERTNIQLSANYSTSSEFVRRRTFDPRELNQTIDSNMSLNRRFDWGSLSMGASRRQALNDNTVTTRLPGLGLSVSTITLFEALAGEEKWYSNATWGGNMEFGVETKSIDPSNEVVSAQSRRDLTSSLSSRFTMGKFSLNQNFRFSDNKIDERLVIADTTETLAPGSSERRGQWSTNVSFLQSIPGMGSTNFTPSVALNGEFIRNPKSGNVNVNAPLRVDFSAGLQTDIYGTFGGVGSFSAIRHKISPGFSYGYSPEATADSLQKVLFGGGGKLESNRVTFQLNQTIEAKPKNVPASSRMRTVPGQRPGETMGVDTLGVDTVGAAELNTVEDTTGGPRQREQAQAIKLLGLQTSMLVYDFVKAREIDQGFETTELTNTISSDLLGRLSVTVSHSLFDTPPDAAPGEGERRFSPFLTGVRSGFALNGNSWLFRILRLGGNDADSAASVSPQPIGATTEAGPAIDRSQTEFGMVGTSRRAANPSQRGNVGDWNANFDYSLTRNRHGVGSDRESQMVQMNFNFQATENWSVDWRTGYRITENEFSDHALSLTRQLHDWDANFDFIKAQNGNFSFQFRVQLRANPDIKVDYSQNDLRGLQSPGFR